LCGFDTNDTVITIKLLFAGIVQQLIDATIEGPVVAVDLPFGRLDLK
jgi:hypothetical protein